MADKTSIGDRMKEYEAVSRVKLTRRAPMIVRVDGKAFHTYTRGFEKPWDRRLVNALTYTAKDLVKEIQGAKLAYVQSDEISVLVTDDDSINTSAWFDKSVQKIASVSASYATAAFNKYMRNINGIASVAHFDSRCFVLPSHVEVCNYFVWRQQDATRNSIMGLAQQHFSHKELHGVNTGKAQDMLWKEKEINWNDLDAWKKRGWCVIRKVVECEPRELDAYEHQEGYSRTVIEADWKIPVFTQEDEDGRPGYEYIESRMP